MIQQPPLLSDHGSNGRSVQMSIAALSNHVQEILNDRRDSTNQTSSLLYKAHLQALDSWHAELPLYTCLQTPNLEDSRMVNPKADYRQKTAIVGTTRILSLCRCWLDLEVKCPMFIPRNCLRPVTTRSDERFTRSNTFKWEGIGRVRSPMVSTTRSRSFHPSRDIDSFTAFRLRLF
jgi:hypothetical protein